MKDALEEEKEDLEQWEGGLNGVVGWEEWKALVSTFERALMWLPNVCLYHSCCNISTLTSFSSCRDYGSCISLYFLTPCALRFFLIHMHDALSTVSFEQYLRLSTLAFGFAISFGQNQNMARPLYPFTDATSRLIPVSQNALLPSCWKIR